MYSNEQEMSALIFIYIAENFYTAVVSYDELSIITCYYLCRYYYVYYVQYSCAKNGKIAIPQNFQSHTQSHGIEFRDLFILFFQTNLKILIGIGNNKIPRYPVRNWRQLFIAFCQTNMKIWFGITNNEFLRD